MDTARLKNPKIERNSASAPGFWAGFFFGWIVLVAATAGLGYYWYVTQDPHLQTLVKVQADRLDEQLQKQSVAFQSLLEKLSDQQSATFEQMLEESQSRLGEDFDVRLARLVDSSLEKLYAERDRQTNAMASEAFATANLMLSEGDIRGAGLYFSNGVQHDPGNWQAINAYSAALITWAETYAKDVDAQAAIEVLAELENYLPTRFVFLPPQYLDDATGVLNEAIDARQNIEANQAIANRSVLEEQALTAVTEIEELLASAAISSLQETEAQLSAIDTALVQLELGAYSDSAIDKRLLESATRRREQLAQQIQIYAVLSQAGEHAALADDSALSRKARLSQLVRAEQIINQIDMSLAEIPQSLRSDILTLAGEIDKKAEAISVNYSKELLSKMDSDRELYKAYMKDELNPQTKCYEALQKLQAFYSDSAVIVSQITDPTMAKIGAEKLALIRKSMLSWEQERRRRYSEWAVGVVNTFHSEHKDELKALTDTDETQIYNDILKSLGVIDTTQLTYAASLTFSEVFGLYYVELEQDQKIKLTGEMAEKTKTSIDSV